MSDDYKDEPISLGEKRVEKSNCSMDISPREMFVSILRMIDSGEINPDKAIAVISLKDDDRTHVFAAQTKTYESVGLAMEVIR